MNWLPTRVVELSEMTLPSDWRDRMANARAKEFAAVLKNTEGPINLPVVEASTGEIVAGVDRIAALVTGGEKRFECRIWTGSPAEKKLVRASENLHRRKDDDATWLAEYLEAVKGARQERREAQLTVDPTGKSRGKGRPKSEHGEAREQAAKELGMSPEAVRSTERRAEAKAAKDAAPPVRVTPEPVRVETRLKRFGDQLAELKEPLRAFLTELTAANAQEAIMSVDTALQRLVGCEDAVGRAVEAIERGRKALADANRPIEQVRASRNPAMRAPQVGLGGRKLHNIIDGETGQAFDFGDEEKPPEDDGSPDTEVAS